MAVEIALDMATVHKVLYEFGPFRADPDRQVLLRDNQPVPITPKVFETLLLLVRRNGEVVTKDDLMKELWPDAFVEESNLSQNIFMLRKVLGDAAEGRRYIVTIPGRGYRFATDVRVVRHEGDQLMIASHTRSQVEIEQTDSEVGNANVLPAWNASKVSRIYGVTAVVVVVGLLVVGASFFARWRRPAVLRATDPVLITDFTNTTGDAVFDDTLRQGLIAQLEQSPFVSLMPEDRVRHTLQLMGQPAGTRMTPGLGREVCARAGGSAVLDGSIARLGNEYVVGLRAMDCHDGAILDEEQAQAARKEDVLNALTQIASRFRTRVGESLATIQEHDTALVEATTPSLEALKAYSTGRKLESSSSDELALPFFQRATTLDSNFAMAYAFIGRIDGDMGEAELSAENTRKAYELREHISDPEKFLIMASYDMQVSENLERARQTCEVWEQTYPRDPVPKTYLAGVIYPVLGRYEEAVDRAQKAQTINPDFAIVYFILATRYQELGSLDKAEESMREAAERKLDIPEFALERYDLAYLRGDAAEMNRIADTARADALADEWVTQHVSSVAASAGRVDDARKELQRTEALAREAGHMEAAALYEAGAAVWEAFFGNKDEARRKAVDALKLSNNRGVEYGAALALALSGGSARAQQLTDDLDRRFPEDTGVQFNYLPTLRAQLALNRGEPARAIELLEKAAPYELGTSRVVIHANFGALYPVYVRGEAYVALHKNTEAAQEFQKILDHRGIVVSDPVYPVALVQLGRAYAMSGDTRSAGSSYREFLALWKHADPDIPLLRQVGREYAKVAEDR